MKVRNVVTLCMLLVATCWGQNGYPTNYHRGVMDVTSYCTSGTNCFKQLVTEIAPLDGAIGSDGYMLWRKTDNSLHTYSTSTYSWSQPTFSDPYTKQIVVQNANTIYRLKNTDSYCGTGPTFRTQKLVNGAWVNLTSGNDCQSFMAAGRDGTLMAIGYGNANGAPVYKFNFSTGGWVGYGTTNMLFLSVASADAMCGLSKVSGSMKVYVNSDTTNDFVMMPTQPATSNASGCAISNDATVSNGQPVLYVWSYADNTLFSYDFPTATWKQITLPNVGTAHVGYVVTAGSAATFLTMGGGTGGGYVHHFNVLAAYANGNTVGSQTGCHTHSDCPYHNLGTLRTHFANGGLHGTQSQQSAYASDQINIPSWDVNPLCDEWYGDPQSGWGDLVDCTINVDGDVHSEQDGTVWATPGPVPIINDGTDALTASGVVMSIIGTEVLPVGYAVVQDCSAPIDACEPFTSAFCPSLTIVQQDVIVFGDPTKMTAAEAISKAAPQCEIEGGTPNAWRIDETYENDDINTCVYRRTVPVPKGYGTIFCK